MKYSLLQIDKFVKLAGLDNANIKVLNVLNHAYQIDCALELCFKPFKEWLNDIIANSSDLKDVYEEMYYLYIFRGEIVMCCKSMSLEEAIEYVKIEFINK